MLLLTNFAAKCEMVFGLNTGKHFLVEVSLRLIDRPYVPLKNGTNDF